MRGGRTDVSTDGISRMMFFFSSRRRHTRFDCDWSSDVCSSDLIAERVTAADGSIGKLLAAQEGAAGTGQAAAAFQAAVAHGAVQRYGFALRQAPFQARGGFTAMLDGLLEQLREQARAGGETTRGVEAT